MLTLQKSPANVQENLCRSIASARLPFYVRNGQSPDSSARATFQLERVDYRLRVARRCD